MVGGGREGVVHKRSVATEQPFCAYSLFLSIEDLRAESTDLAVRTPFFVVEVVFLVNEGVTVKHKVPQSDKNFSHDISPDTIPRAQLLTVPCGLLYILNLSMSNI